jgi:hypothetical protein
VSPPIAAKLLLDPARPPSLYRAKRVKFLEARSGMKSRQVRIPKSTDLAPFLRRRLANAKPAPEDYRKPDQFFARTCFTRALREHAGMVLRRLSGRTENIAPVLTLITQFGGGKTHTLTALYHLVTNGESISGDPGVADLRGQQPKHRATPVVPKIRIDTS